MIFGLGLGDLDTTDNADTSYTHAIIPFDLTGAAATGNAGYSQPPITGFRYKSGPTQGIIHSAVLDTFELNAMPGGRPEIKANFIGSGEVTADGNSFATAAQGNLIRLTNFQVGVAASEISLVNALVDLTFNWTNDLQADLGYIAGSDIYRGQCLVGKRDFELSIKCREHSTATERAAYLAQTLHKAIITFTGANIAGANDHNLVITLNNVRLNEYSESIDGKYRTFEAKYKGYYVSGANHLDVSVTNTGTGYMVLDS